MRAVHKLSVPMISLAVLALAACGGSATASGSSTTTTTPTGRGARNAAFAACLKDHGVTLPGGFGRGGPPGSRPSGASGPRGGFFGGDGAGLSTKDRAAFQACRSKLPNGGRFGGGFGANATALKAYLSCLGDNGVKVPKVSTAPIGASGPSGPSGFAVRGGFRSPLAGVRNDPHFAAASKTCRALLPARGTSSSTTTPAG
jgi:hypothetical protein